MTWIYNWVTIFDIISSDSICKQFRPRSACADAQADLIPYFLLLPIFIPPKTLFGGVYRSQLVGRSVRPSVGRSVTFVRSISHKLLDEFYSNFTGKLSIKQRCAYEMLVMVHWFFTELWPFHEISFRSFSHQLLDRCGSNYANRLSIKQRCAYRILVMVYLGFMELWPFDDSTQQRCAYHKLFLVN